MGESVALPIGPVDVLIEPHCEVIGGAALVDVGAAAGVVEPQVEPYEPAGGCVVVTVPRPSEAP